jgi:hypothetical protein
MCSTYKLGVDSVNQLGIAYKLLVNKEPPLGHVARIHQWTNERYSELIASPQERGPGVMLARSYVPGVMNWTHCIFRHVSHATSKLLTNQDLKVLCRGEKIQQHTTGADTARALFGWETTAVSATNDAEAALVSDLVRTMAYIWEIQWIISTIATDQLRSVARKDDRAALQQVRDFRRYAAVLMASCHPSRLSMIERHFHRSTEVMREWHLSDLGSAIRESTDLLDATYTHAQQERTEERLLRLTVVLALLAFFTLVSVTKDAADFIEDHDQWRFALRILVFFPAVAAAAIYFLVVFLLWLRRRPEKQG